MNVVHFIGSEIKGGNVRYAQVMHHCLGPLGINSLILPVGQIPSLEMLQKCAVGPITIFFHATGTVTRAQLRDLRKSAECRLIVFAHNPQPPKNWDLFDLVVPVSQYVLRTLLESGVDTHKIYHRPAYLPIASLTRAEDLGGSGYSKIEQFSEYDWNLNKPRDIVLSWFDRIGLRPWRYGGRKLITERELSQSKRIRLGIVSRIARLKQFPELFRLLRSGLMTTADRVEIHIVGSGPWGQIQDLKSQIPAPLRAHVFFWGWQRDPWACLPKVHALLLGMPEKEALGLNILEATTRKIPVIGIDGGPFSEVIESGRNGWLLPENTIQKNFAGVISKLESEQSPCSFEMSASYTYRFSEDRFHETLKDLLNA